MARNIIDLPTLGDDGRLYRDTALDLVESLIPNPWKSCHAPDLLELENGDLLCCWFAGSREGNADISIAVARLPADAEQWEQPVIVSDDPTRSEQNPSLFQNPNGDIWLMYTAQAAKKPDDNSDDSLQGTAEIRRKISRDGGRTWGPTEAVFTRPGSFCRQKIQVLSNGRWIFNNFICALDGTRLGSDVTVIQISDDQGKTWRGVEIPESRGRVHGNVNAEPPRLRCGSDPEPGRHDGRHGSLRCCTRKVNMVANAKKDELSLTPMLNAYPDSLGGTLSDIADLLESNCKDAFGAFYILPSVFNTDLDRGFSVVDYSLNELLATPQDLERIRALGIRLKLDFILNHASVLSPQFQDLLKNGEMSKYKDFFIDWNAFWAGCGEMMPGGYIQPTPEYLHKMFFRKPGLPILMVRMPDGTEKPYWNTFYQQVDYPCPDARELVSELGMQYRSACVLTESLRIQLAAGKRPAELDLGRWETLRVPLTDLLESRRRYLGQMDLNVASPLVWKFYADTLHTLAGYGASIVRLDAFAYAHKAVGERNFLNEPGTWSLLARLQTIADADGVTLLPEIHASYGEKVYEKLAAKGYAVYDFFLPGLMIDALERGNADTLAAWAQEILDKHILTVNMLGCHDGIPMLDLKGLLPEERIQNLIDLIVTRGGMVKNLHGQKNVYYQVNATYYSALGESDAKLLLARAIQLFMPGKPQVWYLDLFAGKNDCEAVARAGEGGHKEINRTNLTKVQIAEALEKPVVKKQLELLRLRRNCPAFAQGAKVQIESCGPELTIEWSCSGHVARLQANLQKLTYRVEIE